MEINLWSAIGALGIIVGPFLPWYTEVYSTTAQLEYTGIERGWATTPILVGAILLVLALFAANSTSKIKLWAAGLLSAFAVFYGFAAIMASREEVQIAGDGLLGLGVWVLMAGAVLHFVAFLVSVRALRFISRPQRE